MALWRRPKGGAENTTKAFGKPGARATGVVPGKQSSGRSRVARSADSSPLSELLLILDEELAGCRAHIAPLVLCYLEGRTQDEAARQLGWTLGSFRGRLKRGRARLRDRLSAAASDSLFWLLSRSFGRNGSRRRCNHPSSTRRRPSGRGSLAIPAGVVGLAEGEMGTMVVAKLQWAAGVVAVCGMLTVGGVWATGQGPGPGGPGARGPRRTARKTKPH